MRVANHFWERDGIMGEYCILHNSITQHFVGAHEKSTGVPIRGLPDMMSALEGEGVRGKWT